MADINDLLIRIDATTEQLRREMKRAEQVTDSSTKRMGGALQNLDRRFDRVNQAAARARAAIGAVIAALAVRRVAAFAQSQIQMANAIQKAANVAGVSASEIQELRFAFGQLAEVSDTQVDEALQRFNRRLGLARQGSKQYADTMLRLGVNLNQQTGPALESAIQGLASIENAADRAAAASVIFGDRVGPKLSAALSQGIVSVNDLRKAIRDDGGIIDDAQIAKAEELNDKFDRMRRILTAQFATVVLDNAQAIDDLATAMGKVVTVTTSGLASVINFTRWIGEELAARIHGISADDLPRLSAALAKARKELESLESADRSGLAPAGARYLDRRIEEKQAEIAALENQIRIARNIRVERALEERGKAGPGRAKDILDEEDVDEVVVHEIDFIRTRAQRRISEPMKDVHRIFESTRTEVERVESQIARVRELAAGGFFKEAGIDDEEILARLQERLNRLQEETDEATMRIAEAFANNIGGAMDDLFASGELSAKRFFEAVLRDLARITVQLYVMKPLIESMFGGGGFGGSLLRAFGFAKGADFTVGGSGGSDTQFVPMMLSPGERVQITPNGGGSSGSIVQNFNIPIAFPPQLDAHVRNIAGPAGRDAAMAVLNAQRGRM
jgi:hypothetical protein